MKKRKLGHSNLEITPIGLGSWGIGGPPFWPARDENESLQTIEVALDNGINLIDTAPVYGFGRSEKIIGKAIRGKRDKIIIATKCGLRWKNETLKGLYNNLKPASICEEVESSLTRIGTDYIDLYQVHWPDPGTSIEETMVALYLLKKQGKIREIGVSNFDKAQLESAMKIAPVISVQPKYNMLERDVENSILPFCIDNNLGVLAYSPLASGILSGKYDQDSKFDGWRGKGNFGIFRKETFRSAMKTVQKLKEYTVKRDISMTHLAIWWVMDQPGVTCALAGANTPAQIKDTINASVLALSTADRDELSEILDNIQKREGDSNG